MFGSPWLDGLAVVIFVAVAVVSLARLAVAPRGAGRAGAVAHSAMAVGMAAMALPAADPVPRWGWLVVFASVACWFAGQLLRLGPASGPAGLAMGRRAWRRRAWPAAHHLAGSVLMLAAIVVGHGRAVAPHAHAVTVPEAHAHGLLGAGGPLVPAPLTWLLCAGFLLVAAWWTVDLVRGTDRGTDRGTGRPRGVAAALAAPPVGSGCSVVMAAGMGAMALVLG